MEIQKILREAYLKYGDNLFLDNQKLISSIRDLLSNYPSEIKKITLIVNENIVSKIIKEIDVVTTGRGDAYVQMLVDNYSMEYEVARKFISYFIYATKGIEYQQSTMTSVKIGDSNQVNENSVIITNNSSQFYVDHKEDVYVDSDSTEFSIEDIFSITGRGVVLVGKISKGEIFVGDELTVGNNKCIVTAIEKFRKLIDHATHEDGKIGLLVKNIKKDDVKVGMTVKKNQGVEVPENTITQPIPRKSNTYRINDNQTDVPLSNIEKNGYSIYVENSKRKINHSMLNCVVYYNIDHGITSIEINGTELSKKEMLKLKFNRKIEFDMLKIMAQDIFSFGKIEGITFVCTNGYWEVKYIICEGDIQKFRVADDLNLIQSVMEKVPYNTLDYDSKIRIEKVFILCDSNCNKQIMTGDWTAEYKSLLAIDLFLQKFDEKIGCKKRSDVIKLDVSMVTHDEEIVRLHFSMLRLLHIIAKRMEVRTSEGLIDCVKLMNTLMESVFGYRK